MACLQQGFRAVFYRKPVIGGHQGFQDRLVGDESGIPLRLRTPCRGNLNRGFGFRAQGRDQIFADMLPHTRLDQRQHRRREKKHDRSDRQQKLGTKMLEWPREHAQARLRKSARLRQTLWPFAAQVRDAGNL